MATSLSARADILADLWLNYRTDEEFEDFIEYNDLGLPIAYAYVTNMVKLNKPAEQMIDESFNLLLAGLGVEDIEEGYENLDDLLGMDF